MNISIKIKSAAILSLSVFLIFVVTACEDKGKAVAEKPVDINEIVDIQHSEIEQYVERMVYKSLNDYEELELEGIDVFEDKLLLQRKTYLKTVSNIFVEVTIGIDESTLKTENISETIESFLDTFMKNEVEEVSHERVRLKQIDFIFPDESLNVSLGYVETNDELKNMNMEQDETLRQIDETIYNAFSDNMKVLETNSEWSIQRMGVDGNTFLIESRIFYYSGEEEFFFEKVLPKINEKTMEILTSNSNLINDLRNIGIKNVQFIYHNRWSKIKEPKIYDYQI